MGAHHHETASPLFQAGFLAFVSRFQEEPKGLAWSVYKGHEVEMVWGWFFRLATFGKGKGVAVSFV